MNEYKYHYLYKITNKITGEYYYGVHSTNNLEDKYFGSGVNLSKNIKKYGKNNFVKENIEYFPSRKELMIAEKNLVTKDMLMDKNCLNVIVGGGELKGSVGKKCIVDENGKYKMVNKNDDKYKGFMTGRVCINDGENMKYIIIHDLDRYINMGWCKGSIQDSPCKGKIWMHDNNKSILVEKKNIEERLNNGLKIGMFEKDSKVWIHKNDNTMLIDRENLDKYIGEGWCRGTGFKTVSGKIMIIKENKRKYICPLEVDDYINNGWNLYKWSNTVWINNGEKNTRINISDIEKYTSNGWVKGRLQNKSSKSRGVIFYDMDGNVVMEFDKVSLANKSGYNNIHKYADLNKIYMRKFILKYK